MIWALAAAVWVSLAAGLYLCLSRDVLRIVLGLAVLGAGINLAVLGAGINLALLASGRLGPTGPAVIPAGEQVLAAASNPLPQALVLTAIVIGFALACWAFVLVLGLIQHADTDDTLQLREAEPVHGPEVKPPLPQAGRGPEWPPEGRA